MEASKVSRLESKVEELKALLQTTMGQLSRFGTV